MVFMIISVSLVNELWQKQGEFCYIFIRETAVKLCRTNSVDHICSDQFLITDYFQDHSGIRKIKKIIKKTELVTR